MNFSEKLQLISKSKGLTQEELADIQKNCLFADLNCFKTKNFFTGALSMEV